MATILTKRYSRETDIPTIGLRTGELIIAIDTRSLWICISPSERVKVSDNINVEDFLQKELNLQDVPDKEKARVNLEVYSRTEVDHFLQGLKWKSPVRVISDRNIDLRGITVIDSIELQPGDRVLVNGQSHRNENGIYTVSEDHWKRANDTDESSELLNAAVFVSEGTVFSDTAWVCTTDPPIEIETTSIRFVQFSALTYVHPTGFTSQPSGSVLANSIVISRILVNNEGHVTGISTRSLTPANIGAAPASHSHAILSRGNGLTGDNYNGSAPVTWAVNFAGNGEALSVARSDHNHDNQYAPYGHNHYLTSLADVLIDSLEDGDILSYDSTLDNWVNVKMVAGDQYWQKTTGIIMPVTPEDHLSINENNFFGGNVVLTKQLGPALAMSGYRGNYEYLIQGDVIGQISFFAIQESLWGSTAYIRCVAADNHSQFNRSSSIQFYTSLDNSPHRAMEITKWGTVWMYDSLIIDQGLDVRQGTLVVDPESRRVGINKMIPQSTLDIWGSMAVSSDILNYDGAQFYDSVFAIIEPDRSLFNVHLPSVWDSLNRWYFAFNTSLTFDAIMNPMIAESINGQASFTIKPRELILVYQPGTMTEGWFAIKIG